jgi:hypothetical protein
VADGARLRIVVREQDVHVLDGRDQVILDLLMLEPAPARTSEVVIAGRISKTASIKYWHPLRLTDHRNLLDYFLFKTSIWPTRHQYLTFKNLLGRSWIRLLKRAHFPIGLAAN